MLKNIYTPVAGAIAHERAIEAISNNLANANTAGFKADQVTFSLLDPEPYKNYQNPLPPANFKFDWNEYGPLRGNDMSYVGVAGMEKDFAQGPAITTYNKFDLMIEGDGFFKVQTSEGQRLMRAGDLSLSTDRVLVSKFGDPILGENGLIYINSNDFEINELGEVIQNGEVVDRLALVDVADKNSLERMGQNYYFHNGPAENIQPSSARIRQGFIEGSNVNSMKNLTSLILAHRSYEAYQKAVSNYDQIMEKSSNAIGQVRA